MTENELRKQIIALALSWVGVAEGTSGHRYILDEFNSVYKSYKMKPTDAWCATTYSALFIEMQKRTGLPWTTLIPIECSCPRMVTKSKTMGIWVEDDAHVPTLGSAILYDWNDNGVGDNMGYPDHIGMVVGVTGNYITVVEGNMGRAVNGRDGVGKRTVLINGRYIRGFIEPKFALLATGGSSSTANASTPKPVEKPATSKTDNAAIFCKGIAGDYYVRLTSGTLSLRSGADTSKKEIAEIPNGAVVKNYGYASAAGGKLWLYVSYGDKVGFVHGDYLRRS